MQLISSKALIATSLVVSVVSGCSLPSSGPRGSAIVEEATSSLVAAPGAESSKFVLLDVAARTSSGLSEPSFASLHSSFGAASRSAARPTVSFGRGDVLQVTIFEATSGGLFVDKEAGSRPGNFVQLPQQTVDSAGNIKVPYAGNIRVVGRSAESVQSEIEQKLKDRAIEPQVFISTTTQRGSEVSVLGDVNQANKFAVNPAGERVMEVISRAGGIKNAGHETFVTLQRGSQSVRVPFDRLVRTPHENVFVRPGDIVYVSREPRSYTMLGATGTQSRVPFPAERVALAEAIGTGGGLVDARANPGYVYLYRAEPRSLLVQLGADLSHFDPLLTIIPTVYKANLNEPSSFFAARKFEVRDKDVIYVAGSESVEIVKFFGVLSAITNPFAQVVNGGYGIRRISE
jgi:polysaccharide export outer membrane protein